jgi:tripartite-type tricarboxylate transporter receptor subunit TctC
MKRGQWSQTMKVLAVLCTLLAIAIGASAQDVFPSKPITIVVPYPPGGSTDIVPRMMQPELSRMLGVAVVIENRAGAGGTMGSAQVARAKPDGYTLVIVNTQTTAINPWIYKGLSYDAKDFVPIMNAGTVPNMLVTHPSVPAKNLRELIALAKARPGELTYASSGDGSTSHLCGALLGSLAGVNILHVPYKGPGPAHQDLDGGQVSMMCDALSNGTQEVKSGRLRGILVTTKNRQDAVPEVPTAAEAGLPGLDVGFFLGFAAPRGTPVAVVERLNRVMVAVLRSPEVVKRLEGMGITVDGGSRADFAALIASESAKYQKILEIAGVTAK